MTKSYNMDNARKTAILLLSLDQATAAELLGKLSREQVERVTLAIANASQVTRQEQEAVLDEFKQAFESLPLMRPTGPEAARELLEMSLDKNEVDVVQERIEQQVQAGPFAFLHHREPSDIRMLLQDERPQTIALIVSQLPSDLAAETLAGFPSEFQADVLARMSRLGPTDVGVLSEIAALLQSRVGSQSLHRSPVSNAQSVLQETSLGTSTAILKKLDQADTLLSQSLRDSLFAFRDLARLSDTSLKCVLEQTDHCAWAIALKGSPEVFRRRILVLLPPQVSQALRSEIQATGPLRLSEITTVQNQIAEEVYRMISAGEIDRPKTNPSSPNLPTSIDVGRSRQASL